MSPSQRAVKGHNSAFPPQWAIHAHLTACCCCASLGAAATGRASGRAAPAGVSGRGASEPTRAEEKARQRSIVGRWGRRQAASNDLKAAGLGASLRQLGGSTVACWAAGSRPRAAAAAAGGQQTAAACARCTASGALLGQALLGTQRAKPPEACGGRSSCVEPCWRAAPCASGAPGAGQLAGQTLQHYMGAPQAAPKTQMNTSAQLCHGTSEPLVTLLRRQAERRSCSSSDEWRRGGGTQALRRQAWMAALLPE